MSRIRSRGNKGTELVMARLLRAHKISGWRRHVRVAVEGRKSKVEGKRTSPRSNDSLIPTRSARSGLCLPANSFRRFPSNSSPRRGEGQGISGSRHSSLVSRLAVRPDFVFTKQRTAIFVDGCFWHGCPRHATWPRNNRAFWRRKLSANKTRDRLVNRTLRRAGWRVLRIWECSLQKRSHSCIKQIVRVLG